MADKTYRQRIEALEPTNRSAFMAVGSNEQRAAYVAGFRTARLEAATVAEEADSELNAVSVAADVIYIDPTLPLHERVAILRAQRDNFADFADQVAGMLGFQGFQELDDVLAAVKNEVSVAADRGSIIAERQRTIDDLRERLAIAEAAIANLRGVPEQWRKACEERDALREGGEAAFWSAMFVAAWTDCDGETEFGLAMRSAKKVADRALDCYRKRGEDD